METRRDPSRTATHLAVGAYPFPGTYAGARAHPGGWPITARTGNGAPTTRASAVRTAGRCRAAMRTRQEVMAGTCSACFPTSLCQPRKEVGRGGGVRARGGQAPPGQRRAQACAEAAFAVNPAASTAAPRVRTPSFVRMWATWFSTVRTLR